MSWTEADIRKIKKKRGIKISKTIGRPTLSIKYYKFVLYNVESDLNKTIGFALTSRFKYAKHKKDQEKNITIQLQGLPIIDYKGKYIYSWFMKDKRKDPGNIAGSEKMIGDALQSSGIIENDGWKQISGIEHRFYVDKKNPRLELEIIG